jgi:hypothetical protein
LTLERTAQEKPVHLSELAVLLKKNYVQQSFLLLQHIRHQLSLDEAALRGLNVDSSSDYFVYLCIPVSETMLHPKIMSTMDQPHF